MDKHTLDLLEYQKVRDLVASYALTPLGRERAQQLQPLEQLDAIKETLQRTTEMVEALNVKLIPPISGLKDLRPIVKKASFGVLLEAGQLLQIRNLFEQTGQIYDYWLKLGNDYPRLERLVADVPDLRHLATAIDTVIDDREQVRDSASAELAAIRKQIAAVQEKIQNELRRLLRDSEIRKALRFHGSTLVNDHHVLPVAVNYRHKVIGVVHRTSSTGETVYIEPSRVAEYHAEIAVIRNAEDREIRKVLRRLSEIVRRESKLLLLILDILSELDFLYAKARYSLDFDMTPPKLNDTGRLYLPEARHPLLLHLFREEKLHKPKLQNLPSFNPTTVAGKSIEAKTPVDQTNIAQPEETTPRTVVPVSIHLGGDFDLLIITGPNTGGKTVALKTVGLLALMGLSGLHLPTRPGAEVPLLRGIFADIGDEQSLEQSLSTFSSHISRIAEILKQAGQDSLVLLDELGAGTEPSEGAALGRAILDELLKLKARAMVTTHLNDLKTFALSAPRAENAAMEFDAATLRPTYRLVIGQFGQSCALKIARRLNLPKPLLDRAYHYLTRRKSKETNEEMLRLQEMRQEAEVLRLQAQQAKELAEQEAAEYRKKASMLQQEEEVQAHLARARETLRAGDSVRVAKLGKTAIVKRIDLRKRLATVTVGAIEWQVNLDELVPLTSTN